MHANDIAMGTVEGTGALINVSCGFIPRFVHVINIDGSAEMYQHLAEAKATKRTAGTFSNATANILASYAGSEAANSEGFSIGADADVNASAETIRWLAYR